MHHPCDVSVVTDGRVRVSCLYVVFGTSDRLNTCLLSFFDDRAVWRE